MARIDEITKEEFDIAYDLHPPNDWITFAYRYFSTKALPEDLWLKKLTQGVLIVLFLFGFIGTVINLPKPYIGIATIVFSGILVSLGILMFSAVILNNIRIAKICKFLGITKEEYNILADKFYS